MAARKPEATPQESDPKGSGGIIAGLIRGRAARMSAVSATGLAASSLGLVLGGSVVFGFLSGSWLDHRFGTSYWLPVMLVLGVGAGFRELFHTVRLLNEETEREARVRAKRRELESEGHGSFVKSKGEAVKLAVDSSEASATPESKRSFAIPPPPVPSYLKSDSARKSGMTGSEVSTPETSIDDISTLTSRLLSEDHDTNSAT